MTLKWMIFVIIFLVLANVLACNVQNVQVTSSKTVKIAQGKHVVLITGDEEYRSEEAMPMLAKILHHHHGCKTTVLFAINKNTGKVDPNTLDNIPGLETLKTADLMIVFNRFRNLPDHQMKHVDAYLKSGKPIIGIRPSVVAFRGPKENTYGKYNCDKRLKGGFGLDVLGADWKAHHGKHRVESTLGIPVESMKSHPILRGVGTMWGPTDVYRVDTPIPHGAQTLVMGQVLKGMKRDSEYSPKKQMPLAWTKYYPTENGKTRVFMSTMGDGQDFQDENFRRLMVNACFWAMGLEEKIPAKTQVDILGVYNPKSFGFNIFRKGLSVEELTNFSLLNIKPNDRICFVGNTLGEREQHFGHFETLLHKRFPTHKLFVRNLCRSGDEVKLRIRPDQKHYPYLKDFLDKYQADIVFAFFGLNESFNGPEGLEKFEKELKAWINESSKDKSGKSRQIVLVSPIPFEKSNNPLLPDGQKENQHIKLYCDVMAKVALEHNVIYADLFTPVKKIMETHTPLTFNGIHLSEKGYKVVMPILDHMLFGPQPRSDTKYETILNEVLEKNRVFYRDHRAVNGVHWYGRRYKPFGPENYPAEFKKLEKMTANRDLRVWKAAQGISLPKEIDDSNTGKLNVIKTNLRKLKGLSKEQGITEYLDEKEALKKFTLEKGYQINLFASEKEFPELQNPLHLSFDDKGRLWVSCLPTYPHILPEEKFRDKILILEDTDGDGRADKKTTFADNLYLPTSFEFHDGGIILAQQPNLVFLKDTNGDGRADYRKILIHGFDSHDTHVAIASFLYSPGGALLMYEGIFQNTAVETPYGPIRSHDGGVYRYEPRSWKLDVLINCNWPNPWGASIDDWGQHFITDTSGGSNYFGTPISHKLPFHIKHRGMKSFTSRKHHMRPTCGCETVSSRNFPDSAQGDFLIGNTIGFLGIKQHKMKEDGSGWLAPTAIDLVRSSDPNFRPVDLLFGPEGALYIADWCNALIGHMQHNARDPMRDKTHGRIWRLTYTKKPLVKPSPIHGASLMALLDNLKAPEFRTRYRTRRALGQKDRHKVMTALDQWIASLNKNDSDYEHHLLEALWVSQWHHRVNKKLLRQLLKAKDPRARTAAVRVLRFCHKEFNDAAILFMEAAKDKSPKVRLEAVVSASWLPKEVGYLIALEVRKQPSDIWLDRGVKYTLKAFGEDKTKPQPKISLGEEVYHREAHCATCHQKNGEGIAKIYPPLNKSKWVTGDKETLIKLALHGLQGPITVRGKEYKGPSVPPMPGYKDLLNDKEIAAVLTYIRNQWDNKADKITPDLVKKVRHQTKTQKNFYSVKDLIK